MNEVHPWLGLLQVQNAISAQICVLFRCFFHCVFPLSHGWVDFACRPFRMTESEQSWGLRLLETSALCVAVPLCHQECLAKAFSLPARLAKQLRTLPQPLTRFQQAFFGIVLCFPTHPLVVEYLWRLRSQHGAQCRDSFWSRATNGFVPFNMEKDLEIKGPSIPRSAYGRQVSGTSETADIFRSSTFDQVLLAVYGKVNCHPLLVLHDYATHLVYCKVHLWIIQRHSLSVIYLVDPNGFGGGRMAEKKSCHKVLLAAPIFLGDNEDFVDELSLDLPGCIWLFRPACSHKTSDIEMP